MGKPNEGTIYETVFSVEGGKEAHRYNAHDFERVALHRPFSLAKRQVAVLGTVVEVFVRSVFDAGCNLSFGRTLGSKLACDETLRHTAVLLHQPHTPAKTCSHNDLVKMPDIAGVGLTAS